MNWERGEGGGAQRLQLRRKQNPIPTADESTKIKEAEDATRSEESAKTKGREFGLKQRAGGGEVETHEGVRRCQKRKPRASIVRTRAPSLDSFVDHERIAEAVGSHVDKPDSERWGDLLVHLYGL